MRELLRSLCPASSALTGRRGNSWQRSCTLRGSCRHGGRGGRHLLLSHFLVCGILLALLNSARAQDLFVSNERPPVVAEARHDSLLNRLWASVSNSHTEDRETAVHQPRDLDSKLRGRHLVNESRADDVVRPASSAPARLLAGDDSSKSSLIIKITIFGEMGEKEERPWDERLEEAEQWMFVVIGKSINSGRKMDRENTVGIDAFDFDSLGDEYPEVDFYETMPFEEDPKAPGGPGKDQRSPMKRSHFTFTFKNLPMSQATQFAQNFCGDYKEHEELLLQGFQRALENSDLDPDEGFKAGVSLGTGLRSVIHPKAKAVSEPDKKVIFECEDTQAKPTSPQGALFLPECPENSARCAERPELCTEGEKAWHCKCFYGYDTNVKLVGMDNMKEVTQRFHYAGQCEKRRGYCPPQSDHGDVMEREDESTAWGVIAEIARPRCENGYLNTGTAECMGTSRDHGTWTPDRWCKFDPPREPPRPHCEEPDPSDGTIVATGCKYCRAGSPAWLPETVCPCTVYCAADHKEVAGVAQGRKQCLDFDFTPQCPAHSALKWLPGEDEGKRCRGIADNLPTKDFCCQEAWTTPVPKELESTSSCIALTKDDQCLRHRQADTGAPCCWNEQGYKKGAPGGPEPWCAALGDSTLITLETQPQACAVGPRIPAARWEDLPMCVKTCENIFSKHSSLVVTGCNNCVPGESAEDCGCHLACKSPLLRIGGGPIGDRTCFVGTQSFEQPPVCQDREPTPICAAKLESTNYTIIGCEACPAGFSSADCPCHVECARGYKLTGSIMPGEKTCKEVPNPLKSAECSSLTEKEACVSVREAGDPCCWIPDIATKCQARGSPLITINSLPEKCAKEKMAEWEEFPQCEMKCENVFSGVPNVVESNTDACDDCIASNPHACLCKVECKPGSFHVGGGPVGDRKCVSLDGGYPGFGQAPVCMMPEESSESFVPGTSEVKSKCTNPVSGDMGLLFMGCLDCEAEPLVPHQELRFLQGAGGGALRGSTSCPCKVECATGFKRVGTVEAGEKKCKEVLNLLRTTTCTRISSREECVRSSQNGGDQGGEPCCWKQGGFKVGGGGPECAARRSPDIGQPPERCANTLKGQWEAFPTCKQKCPNIYKSAKDVEHRDCDDCIPGEHCPCNIRCAADPNTGERLVRVGGGPEVWDSEETQQCNSDLKFPEPPICEKRSSAGEAEPLCNLPASLSLLATSCKGCTAGKACKCYVACASGYKQTPETLSKTGDLQGNKQCKSVPAKLDGGRDCIEHRDESDCVKSKDKATGRACCWRSKGFLRSGALDRTLRCAPIGESQYIGFARGGAATYPDQCAATKSYEWEPMPTCHALCYNSFKGDENLVVSPECDECFADFPDDCRCMVTCKPKETAFFAGDGVQGPQRCGSNEKHPTIYPPAPRCVAKEPPDAAVCDEPDNQNLVLDITGCSDCIAREDDKACQTCVVRCTNGYKSVGDIKEGHQICKQGIFRCPKKVDFHQVSRSCTNRETGAATNLWCCGEAHFSPADYPKVDCSTIKSEDTCLHSMDQASGKQCCWRKLKYANGNQCAADEGDVIDDQHLPDACANRPKVFSGHWTGMPTCEKKCSPDVFTAEAEEQGVPLVVSPACGDCVASQPERCACEVTCKGGRNGPIWVGGGPEGARSCNAETGFGTAPICALPDSAPVCDVPEVDRAIVTNCEGCVAGGDSCKCMVLCDPTCKDTRGLTALKKSCQKIPAELTLRECTTISDKKTCLASKDSQPAGWPSRRCCWRDQGFSRTAAGGGSKCVPEGTPLMEYMPSACAPQLHAEWDEMPTCKPRCRNVFKEIGYLMTTDGCDSCIAGQRCLTCVVTCRTGYTHVGGGQPGPWECTEDEPNFKDPPLCQADKSKFCTFPSSESLEVVQGCTRCKAGEPCQDGCSVKCAPHFLQTTLPVDKTGTKQCNLVEIADLKDTQCTKLRNFGDCTNAKEGDQPCCYHSSGLSKNSGPKCARRGDPAIKVLPEACTVMKAFEWDEMPSCEHACEHFFLNVPHIAWSKAKCSNACWLGGPCDCEVQCESDAFERIGGGEVGPRSCPSSKMSSKYWMEDPPVCWKKPEPPVCQVSTLPAWIKATGCNKCVADQDCPSCHVKCGPNYQHVSGDEGNKKCKLEQNAALKPVQNCEAIISKTDCLRSFEPFVNGNRPCCYRKEGFLTTSVVCLAMHSSKLKHNSRPDQCANMHQGVWEEMPDCHAQCPNIFRRASNIIQDSIEKCDGCIAGEFCACTVKCIKNTFRVPGSGAEGRRECKQSSKSGMPSFDPPPQCEPVCEIPDDKQGRLNLEKCKERCIPGRACTCRISCAPGNKYNGGGANGDFVRCSYATDRSAAFRNLPECNPECEPPNDQFQTLDTRLCQEHCKAEDPKCRCEVKCHGKAEKSAGGGVPGRKFCKFFPGDQRNPAKAMWVNADRSTWGKPGYDEMPNCMSPLTLKVVDARNQQPLKGAVIEMYEQSQEDHQQRRRGKLITKKETDADGLAIVFTMLVGIYFKVTMVGYSKQETHFNRLQQCDGRPATCSFMFSINKKLNSGDINPKGCYVTTNPKQAKFQMRAILSWNEHPKDLDIWVRQHDCAEDIRVRYECFDESDTDRNYRGIENDKCRRKEMVKPNVHRREVQACRSRLCVVDKNGTTRVRTTAKQEIPLCPEDAGNQFPKWVFWGARYLDRLANRVQRATSKTYKGVKVAPSDWTDDNYIWLNTDQMYGMGPETVTFHNVPPGTYQIAVDQFSSNEDSKNIKDGYPYIHLFLGGNDVMAICEIEESCRANARVWNALNIKVEDMGEQLRNGERKYKIRIIDTERDMIKLHMYNTPTDNDTATDETGKLLKTERFVKDFTSGDYFPWYEEYFEQSIKDKEGYLQRELNNVCYGKCKLADGSTGFEDCLKND